jgi:outer membrane protein
MIQAALLLLVAGSLARFEPVTNAPTLVHAEPEPSIAPSDREPRKRSPWFGRIGIAEAHYNSGASIAIDGDVIPGSSARVTDNRTLIVDVGYDLSDSWAVMLTVGVPPRASVSGRGSVGQFGKLGSVLFGPAIVTAVYRLPEWHRFHPYVGAGGVHLFVLDSHDGAVTQLKAHDSWGFVAQAGVEYRLNRKWELFADYKRIWLRVDADGQIAGAPVNARVKLDPDLISAGIKFHFD